MLLATTHRTAAEKARVAADERDRARLTAEQQARQERNDRAVEAERACDDAVLGQSEATAYADQLVGLARQMSSSAKASFLAMASRADLSTRVGAVLDGS